MSAPPTNKTSFSRRLWNLITKGWIADVPEHMACCEFNCRELHCGQGQWETCEHRLRHMAIAEEHKARGAMTVMPIDGSDTVRPMYAKCRRQGRGVKWGVWDGSAT